MGRGFPFLKRQMLMPSYNKAFSQFFRLQRVEVILIAQYAHGSDSVVIPRRYRHLKKTIQGRAPTVDNMKSVMGGEGPMMIGFIWTFWTLTLVATILRLYTRVFILKKAGIDDGLAVIVLVRSARWTTCPDMRAQSYLTCIIRSLCFFAVSSTRYLVCTEWVDHQQSSNYGRFRPRSMEPNGHSLLPPPSSGPVGSAKASSSSSCCVWL